MQCNVKSPCIGYNAERVGRGHEFCVEENLPVDETKNKK